MDALVEFYREHPWSTAGAVFTSLVVLRSALRRIGSAPLPPGPRGWPIIGSVLDIPTTEPWREYKEWSKKYGDVIYFEALGNKFVILNSLEAINTLLVERAANYSDRIWSPIIHISRHNWSFAFMSYGQEWRDHRRAFHRFFNQTEVHKLHPIIEEEIPNFLRHLLTKPQEFRTATHHFFGNIIMRAAYGAEDPKYNKELIEEADSMLAHLLEYMVPGRFLVGFIPAMRFIPSWFPGAGWKRLLEKYADWNDRFVARPFDDTKARMKNGTQNVAIRSMAVELIEDLPDKDSPDYKYKETVVKNTTAAAYLGGSDTTVSSANTVILALAMYPEVQRKAQEQIDAVVGRDRLPTFNDFQRLPYVQAIVKESGRWHNVVPMALPHLSREDDVYNGMRIPAGTMVFPNAWAVLHDPEVFEDPFEFKPERYLDKNGQIDPSVMDHEVAAFGYGRRICPGRHLSHDTLTTMVAVLVSCFNIKPIEGKEPLSLRVTSENVSYPLPFECRIEPRSEGHVSLINDL